MKNTSIDLYQIDGFDMQRYIDLYRENTSEKDVKEYKPFIPMSEFRYRCNEIDKEEYLKLKAQEELMLRPELKHYDKKRGVLKSTDKIEAKCKYLQDALIRRAYSKKDTMSFSLSASILKAVVGHDYKQMLETFTEMGYLKRGSDFKTDAVKKEQMFSIGEHSTMFTLVCDKVIKVPCNNASIIKYKLKTKEEYEKMRDLALKEVDAKYGKTFREHYITSLKKITIEDEHGLFSYINKQVSEDDNKYYYSSFASEK